MIHAEDYDKHAKFQGFMRREYPKFVRKPYGTHNEKTGELVWYNFRTGELIQFFPGGNYANLYPDQMSNKRKEVYKG